MKNKPLLLHIPHASRIIPDEYKNEYTGDLTDELRRMTDWYTDELFDLNAAKIVFPVSRLVCDVERFRDDRLEEMSVRGMGACYTHGNRGTPIRSLTAEKREAILKRWYDPHHARLTEETGMILKKHGICFIVDCHSFSASPLPYESDRSDRRPDFCIGTDPFHTPDPIAESLADSFLQRGYSVKMNTPYAGTIVPSAFYHTDPAVISVMIEVNRGLYLDGSFRKTPGFSTLKRHISAAIREMITRAGY